MYLGIVQSIKKIKKDFNFDLIFATWAYPDAFAASLIAEKLNKPLVIKVHGTDINFTAKYYLRRKMIRFAFNKSQKIIVVTKALKEKIVQLGINPEKIAVIPNGVDTDVFKALNKIECRKRLKLDLNSKHIVYIGNLAPIKGVKNLVDAMQYLSEQTFLSIVGDGELRADLEERIIALKLSHRIRIVGRKPHEEIASWMNAADVFCLPSLNEGCPNVLLESLACGTPVVATRVGGIPEIIDSEAFGLLVEPNQPKALSDAIGQILKEESGLRLMPDLKTSSWRDNARTLHDTLQEAS